MKEDDFLSQRIALEGELVEVIGPVGRRRVPQYAGVGQVSLLERQERVAWPPELSLGKEGVPLGQPPDMPGGCCHQVFDRA